MQLTELEMEKVNNLLMEIFQGRGIVLPNEDDFISEWLLYDFYNSIEEYIQNHQDHVHGLIANEV